MMVLNLYGNMVVRKCKNLVLSESCMYKITATTSVHPLKQKHIININVAFTHTLHSGGLSENRLYVQGVRLCTSGGENDLRESTGNQELMSQN